MEKEKTTREKKQPTEKKESGASAGSKTAARNPTRRTTLFRRYLRYSLTAVMVSMLILLIIFSMFLINFWHGDRIQTLQKNVNRVANKVESVLEADREGTANAQDSYIVGSMLNVVSDSIDADIFVTDEGGHVILCKDMVGDFGSASPSSFYCKVHNSYFMPPYIVARTSPKGYSTITKLHIPGTKNGTTDNCIVVGTPIVVDGQIIGNIYGISRLQSGLQPFIVQIFKLFLAAAVISFLLTFALAYLFAYSLTKPLQEMSRLTKQYAKGDFSERIQIEGNDELQDLAASLNHMADSLAILDESRQSFVANVSHELKTPMTSIAGFVDGILDGTIPKEKERHYLQIVSKEVKRLAHLVVTMLTLSKIEAGEEELHYSETDLRSLLFNALLSFEDAIDEAGYQIEGFETMPQAVVMADEELLFQVCYNLFDNAVKFTNPGGVIRVAIENYPGRAIVHISNSGKGLSEKECKRIFERFYKVDQSRSEHVKGVGLGLNLAQNIVRLHGGDIRVESEEGGMTTSSFWLPKKTNPNP